MASRIGNVQAVRGSEFDRTAFEREEEETRYEIQKQQLVPAIQRDLRFVSAT